MSRTFSILVAFYLGFVLMLLSLDGPRQAERELKTFLEFLIESV